MNVKSLKIMPWLGSLAALSLFSACGPASEDSDLDIVQGRRVTAQDKGPEKLSTVGLNGCTGTIIARDLVLTAAHCYQGSVSGGYVLFGMQFNGQDRKIVKIAKATVNRNYSGSHDDVALLKLAGELPAGYQPIKLLPPSIPLNTGDLVRQAGYGSDNSPNSFGTLRTVDSRYQGKSRRGALSVRNGTTAACSGDSGGPLYVQKNGEWFTAGVTSTAFMDAQSRCIGGNEYASVSLNYELILSMARELTGRQNPLDTGAVKPEPQPQPQPDPKDPEGPATFAITGELVEQGQILRLKLKNTSGRSVKNCEFTLSPVRSFFGFYAVAYDITSSVREFAVDQTLDVSFQDPYALNSSLSEIQRYTLTKRCQG